MIPLDDYPFDSALDAALRYINRTDWDTIHRRIGEESVICFDVSNMVSVFPHLSLHGDYTLQCYMAREYHGSFGEIAAVKKGNPTAPDIQKGLHFPTYRLPDTAVPPLDALYHDGSPHGYLEALLMAQFLSVFPRFHHENPGARRCLTQPPADLHENWDSFVELSDWRPRLFRHDNGSATLYACWLSYSSPFGSGDGRDSICLREHTFTDIFSLRLMRCLRHETANTNSPIYGDLKRAPTPYCCAHSTSSIQIAKEQGGKDWDAIL